MSDDLSREDVTLARMDTHEFHHSHEWIVSLIRAVKRREPIWNRQHPQYKDREYSMMLWEEVSQETKVDVETARCKWRGLRDTFRVQLRKLNQTAKIAAPSAPTWEYFDEMMFVKDQIYIDINRKKYVTKDRVLEEYGYGRRGDVANPKSEPDDSGEECGTNVKHKSNPSSILQIVAFPIQTAIEQAIRSKMEQSTLDPLPQRALYAETQMSAQSGDDTEDMDYQVPAELCVAEVKEDPEVELQFASSATNGIETCSPRSENNEQETDQTTIQLLQKKLRALQDDNYCFLMSLLPQMKTLTTKQKLVVRIKIQELLFSEILNMENPD